MQNYFRYLDKELYNMSSFSRNYITRQIYTILKKGGGGLHCTLGKLAWETAIYKFTSKETQTTV